MKRMMGRREFFARFVALFAVVVNARDAVALPAPSESKSLSKLTDGNNPVFKNFSDTECPRVVCVVEHQDGTFAIYDGQPLPKIIWKTTY